MCCVLKRQSFRTSKNARKMFCNSMTFFLFECVDVLFVVRCKMSKRAYSVYILFKLRVVFSLAFSWYDRTLIFFYCSFFFKKKTVFIFGSQCRIINKKVYNRTTYCRNPILNFTDLLKKHIFHPL